MPKTILVVNGGGLGHFSLSTEGGVVTVGEAPGEAGLVLQGVRITRIRCEVEVDDSVVLGEELHLGPLHLHLEPLPVEAVTAPAPASSGAPRLQLRVVDGADKGREYLLPVVGSAIVGNSTNKAAGVILHDLYVAASHCRLDVDEDSVLITHLEGKTPTRVNGQPLEGPRSLGLGETLRVGNSHLLLEIALAAPPAAEAPWPEEVQRSRVIAAAAEPKPAAPSTPVPEPWPPRERQVLGHYRLETQLGRGHSGVVFRAQETKTAAVVTLKILAPEFPATNEELQQFARALKVAPQLQHPHLVTFLGAGKTGRLCWIAREHVEGESIEQALQRAREAGKPSWKSATRVAIHLARALGFLHQRKLVHGNITPHNVLIRTADKQTKLADLMLFKALERSKLQQAYLEKKLLAELPYLAPEQTEVGAFVDELADLYSLGAIAYALATGRPPFSASTPEAVLEQVMKAPVNRPSKYQKGIPPALEAAILKLLSKRQEDRYPTAEQLLADLEPLAQEHEIKL